MDISKCNGITRPGQLCPFAEQCLRYAAPNEPKWQSWIVAPYANGVCTYFVANGKEIA